MLKKKDWNAIFLNYFATVNIPLYDLCLFCWSFIIHYVPVAHTSPQRMSVTESQLGRMAGERRGSLPRGSRPSSKFKRSRRWGTLYHLEFFSPISWLPVLGIRDILVRIWICGSVPLSNGSGCPFLSDFKHVKKISFFIFCLITYPQAHYI